MDFHCWHWRWRKVEVCPMVDWSEQAAVWSSLGQLTGSGHHPPSPSLCSTHRRRCQRTLDASLEYELGQKRLVQPLLWGTYQSSHPRHHHRGK